MFKRTQRLSNASLMPGFHPSVAVLPFRCTVAVVPFRSYRCRCRENGIDGNGNGATEFFLRMQRNSYGAYGILTEFS